MQATIWSDLKTRPVASVNQNFLLVELDYLTGSYLAPFTGFRRAVDLDQAVGNQHFCNTAAVTQPGRFEKVMQLDIVVIV